MKLYTIGYEHAGQLSLIARLREAGVARVIDVRDLPNSRRAGFSKRALTASLAAEGIAYVYLRATPSCLLCLEADHSTCHRARVAEELARRHGFSVEHLRVELASMV